MEKAPEVNTPRAFIEWVFAGRKEHEQIWTGAFNKPKRQAIPAGAREDSYFCAMAMSGDRRDMAQAREKDCRVFALVLDDVPIDQTLPLTPSYRIETSAGNTQCGYLLEPTLAYEQVTAVIDGLVADGWTDPGARGMSRVFRLPGSINTKEGKNRFEARIIDQTDVRYDLGHVKTAFNITTKVVDKPVQDDLGALVTAGDVMKAINLLHTTTPPKDQFSWWRCAAAFHYITVQAGMADAGRLIFHDWSGKDPDEYDDKARRRIEDQWRSGDVRGDRLTLGTLTSILKDQVEIPGREGRKLWFDPDDFIDVPPPVYIADQYVEEGTVGIFYGPPNQGKTFVMLDLALALATGQDWLGSIPVKQGHVVYLAGEGHSGMRRRAAAWAEHKGENIDHRISMSTEAMPLNDTIADVRAVLRDDTRAIVIDTFSTMFTGESENNNTEVAQWLRGLNELRVDHPKITIILVHHTGKNDSGSLRGASALLGNVDWTLSVKEGGQDGFVLGGNPEDKNRDGIKHEAKKLTGEVVDMGQYSTLVMKPFVSGDDDLEQQYGLKPRHLTILETLDATGKIKTTALRNALGLKDSDTQMYKDIDYLAGKRKDEEQGPRFIEKGKHDDNRTNTVELTPLGRTLLPGGEE